MAKPDFSHEDLLEVGEQVLTLAKRHGAQKADTVASYGTDFEVKVADGSIANLTQATAKGLGLRVLVDGSRARFDRAPLGAELAASSARLGAARGDSARRGSTPRSSAQARQDEKKRGAKRKLDAELGPSSARLYRNHN